MGAKSAPVSRVHLVLGKFLMVLTASLFAAGLSLTSMALTLRARCAGTRLAIAATATTKHDNPKNVTGS